MALNSSVCNWYDLRDIVYKDPGKLIYYALQPISKTPSQYEVFSSEALIALAWLGKTTCPLPAEYKCLTTIYTNTLLTHQLYGDDLWPWQRWNYQDPHLCANEYLVTGHKSPQRTIIKSHESHTFIQQEGLTETWLMSCFVLRTQSTTNVGEFHSDTLGNVGVSIQPQISSTSRVPVALSENPGSTGALFFSPSQKNKAADSRGEAENHSWAC